MLTFYIIIDLITAALFMSLTAIALSYGGHKIAVNRVYSLFSVFLVMWLISTHASNNLEIEQSVARVFNYMAFGFAFLVVILLLKLMTHISNLIENPKAKGVFGILGYILWPSALISFTPLVAKDIEVQELTYGVVAGPLFNLYGIILIAVVLASVFVITWGLKNQTGLVKKQLRIIGSSLLVIAPITIILQFVLPVVTGNFIFSEFGMLPLLGFALAIHYTVIRHRLFDIKLAAVRAFGYALSISLMATLYFTLAYGVSILFFKGASTDGVSFSPINIAIALILALIFQPIKRFFDRVTNSLFYRGEYNQETFFREFGRILSFDTDLRLLLRQASAYIANNLKSERVLFYIHDRGIFGQNGARRLRIPKQDIQQIADYYKENHEMPEVIVTEIVRDKAVEQTLLSHRTQIVLPLILQDQAIGWLFIGEHKSRGYTVRDVRVLESIANELTIAIQNSLSVEEIRDLNETLQRRVDEATKELRASNRQLQRLDEAKDEFISMASHQMRTPLTSIKGYLDMVLEGDLGRISATQRAVLSEAFVSSERMVSLISDFLNVSRLQTGKFAIERHESDLKAILNEELQMLAVMAKQRNLKIKKTIDKDIPLMDIDADKLRQVISNMIDNAIYYSKTGTTIAVSLTKETKKIIFTVKDTGIGVPKSEQSGLFSKFFRASNARKRRPDGTGVGLFLSKKVILLHGGQVIFESQEGKGSTFGFSLPLVENLKKADDSRNNQPDNK